MIRNPKSDIYPLDQGWSVIARVRGSAIAMPSSSAQTNALRIALAVASAFLAIESCNAVSAGCICPLIWDPVCDSKGNIVAGNTCEAECKELPGESYDRAWCGGTRGGSESLGWVLPPKLVSFGYSDPEYDGVVRSKYLNERFEALLEPSGESDSATS